MKILPILLINAVMVGGGIAVYDQLRDDAPAPVFHESAGLTADELAVLDQRYLGQGGAAEPMLRATAVDERVLARLEALERKLGAAAESAPAEAGGPSEASDRPFASPTPLVEGEEPSEDEVTRFRRLQDRAEEVRRAERERERLAGFLERLEIDLTDEQKEKLLETQRSYRRQWGERMRKVWQSGEDREVVRESMRQVTDALRQELNVEMQEYLSVGDAQKITENLNQLVRGGWGGMRGGPPGRGPGGGR